MNADVTSMMQKQAAAKDVQTSLGNALFRKHSETHKASHVRVDAAYRGQTFDKYDPPASSSSAVQQHDALVASSSSFAGMYICTVFHVSSLVFLCFCRHFV